MASRTRTTIGGAAIGMALALGPAIPGTANAGTAPDAAPRRAAMLPAATARTGTATSVGRVRHTTITIRFSGESANGTLVHLEHDTMTMSGKQRSYRAWPAKTVHRNTVRFRIPTRATHGLVLVYESPRFTYFTDAVPVVIQTYKKLKVNAAVSASYARRYRGKAAWGWSGTTDRSAVWHVGVTSKRIYANGAGGQTGWKRIVIMYRTHSHQPIRPVKANWLPTYQGTVEYNGEPGITVR